MITYYFVACPFVCSNSLNQYHHLSCLHNRLIGLVHKFGKKSTLDWGRETQEIKPAYRDFREHSYTAKTRSE